MLHLIPIKNTDIATLVSSRQSCTDYLKKRNIKGWPTVVTTEPGKHFLKLPFIVK